VSEPTTVRATCRRCGEVIIDAGGVRATTAPHGTGMFVFTCPGCTREVWQAADPSTLLLLRSAGVAPLDGLVPLELIEAHVGPPINWDDVLDAHSGMDHHCCPQDELTA